MIFSAEAAMEQAIELVGETGNNVQDKEEIVQLPQNLLDRIGGGVLLVDL
jgi:hypothetical protein